MKLPQSFSFPKEKRKKNKQAARAAESFNFKCQTFLLMVIAVSGKSAPLQLV